MSRTRSRPATEEKFRNAVLELLERDGCANLGINAVAQIAGSDKVLIYRYFGGFSGLLSEVAKNKKWLPSADEVLAHLSQSDTNGASVLQKISRFLSRHIRRDRPTHKLLHWRKALENPLTQQLNEEWRQLWQTLSKHLAREHNQSERRRWEHSCTLAALALEAELCGETIESSWLEDLAGTLTLAPLHSNGDHTPSQPEAEDVLPTNLL